MADGITGMTTESAAEKLNPEDAPRVPEQPEYCNCFLAGLTIWYREYVKRKNFDEKKSVPILCRPYRTAGKNGKRKGRNFSGMHGNAFTACCRPRRIKSN